MWELNIGSLAWYGSISLISSIFVWKLTPAMRSYALHHNIVDKPDMRLKKHLRQTPYLGGVSVFLSFMPIFFGVAIPMRDKLIMASGFFLLLLIGLIDDCYPLAPLNKLIAQFGVACYFALFLYQQAFSVWILPFFVFWFLLLVNAFNLIDIMDGLAVTVAIACNICFFLLSCIVSYCPCAFLFISFALLLSVFLMYNGPPATIFLGDAGALFIGGFFAILSWYCFFVPQVEFKSLLAAILILAVPIIEVCMLIVIRTAKSIPFYQGSPHHFSQYLQKKCWSVYTILLFTFIGSLLFGVVGILFWLELIGLFDMGVALLMLFALWLCCVFR